MPIVGTKKDKKDLVSAWRKKPDKFLEMLFGMKVWSKQRDVLYSVRDHRRTAVKSGNTVGKSCVAAGVVWAYLLLNKDSIVITTAPTWNQVEDVLWREIAGLRAHTKGTYEIPGQLNKTSFELGENWYAAGLSTNEPERFLGRHSKTGKVLVVIDEAYGVAPEIWDSIERLHPDRILAIGNPDAPTGRFFECFTSQLWNKITISCFDCVRWQLDNERIPGLVTLDWIEERKQEWGEKSALYQSSVLGEFPQEGTDTLISLKWVEAARNKEPDEHMEDPVKIIAADIATSHGQDKTVIGYREGHTLYETDEYQQPLTSTAGMIIRKQRDKYDLDSVLPVYIVLDNDGVGEGVGDLLTANKVGYIEFRGGRSQKALESIRFKNLRTQFYWIVAKKFEKGLYSLKNMPHRAYEKLKSQLCSIKVKDPDPQGRLQIETKEDMRARQMPSPDYADMFMMSEYAYFMSRMADIQAYRWR